MRRLAISLLFMLALSGCSSCDSTTPDRPDAKMGVDMPKDQPIDQPSEMSAEDMKEVAKTRWTVLVYLAADNDLENSGIDDLKEMIELPAADHLQLIVQTDRTNGYNELGIAQIENWRESKRLRIAGGQVEELAALGELNTGDADVLEDFITWGVKTYPADRYVLILWNHGNAWRGYGNDDSDRDQLSIQELDTAIDKARTATGLERFDMLGFDACLMAEDTALRLAQRHARYLLASEEFEPNHGWDYRSLRALAEDSELSIIKLAEEISEGFKQQARDRERHREITLSLLDLSKTEATLEALDAFAVALTESMDSVGPQIGQALAKTQAFGSSTDETRAYHSIDLYHFAQLMEPSGGEVATRAKALMEAIDAQVLYEIDGSYTRDAHGLAAYFPRLPTLYDTKYDEVAGPEKWRAMLKRYHGLTQGDAPAPAFSDGALMSTGTCGDGVCEATKNETPKNCAVDCDRSSPTYDVPGCEALPLDPSAPQAKPKTYPVCVGAYSVSCAWGDYGAWVRTVSYCGDQGRCAAPPQGDNASMLPANYGICQPSASTQGLSCTAQGELAMQRGVDMTSMASISQAFLHFGFYPNDATEPLIVGRVRAQLDAAGQVKTEWDQRLLTLEQGGTTSILFAQSRRSPDEPAIVLHEVPLEYSLSATCACDLPGDPGFADTDGDKISNCLDADDDNDGIADDVDNCPFVENQAQTDTDNDGKGDACATDAGEPTLQCQPDPTQLFGERHPALLRVTTSEVTKQALSWGLFVRTPRGVAEVTPQPGARIWPRVLRTDPKTGTYWETKAPLPVSLHNALTFQYTDLGGQLVVDERGVPQLRADGGALTLAQTLGLRSFYMELVLESFTGASDRSAFVGDAQAVDAMGCEPKPVPLCTNGLIADCKGACVSPALLGDGTCHNGTNGADLRCAARSYDQNDCPSPACPMGLVPDCDGRCFPITAQQRGDGFCHDGTNAALPKLACQRFGYDDGDCPCGDQCSGRGACVSDACMCQGGYTGAYCQTPPTCGDNQCTQGESCANCAADCGDCANACGNGVCEAIANEDCSSCAADCGACQCGDSLCNGTEDCTSCPRDCGACPQCGDTICQLYTQGAKFTRAQGESCLSCANDCGSCQNDCCTPSERSGLWSAGGACSDTTVAQCVCNLDPTCCERGWPQRCRELAVSSCGLNCCTPQCNGKSCGPDGCGGSCGTCAGDQVCSPGGTCALPPRADCCDPYAGNGCAIDNTCESCVGAIDAACLTGPWNARCSALASRDCNTECSCGCIPQCDGKSCGPDGCGGVCGSCGANEQCNDSTGTCRNATCMVGFDECDGDMTSPCETDLLTSATHCGACGRACKGEPNATATCAAGACAPLTCQQGFVDCNNDLGQGGDGCETMASQCPILTWAQRFGDANDDLPTGSGSAQSITTDGNGNIFGVHNTGGDLNFNMTDYTFARFGGVVFSTDSAGQARWAIRISDDAAGSAGDATVRRLATDPTTGDLFIVGSAWGGNLEIGNTSVGVTNGNQAAFVARLSNTTGQPLWATTFPAGISNTTSVKVSATGELYIAGEFQGSFTIGADSYSTNTTDGFVAQLNPLTGAVLDTFEIGAGSDGTEFISDLTVLPGGDLVVVGFSNTPTYHVGGSVFNSSGSDDAFYARFTSAGALVWIQQISTVNEERLHRVTHGPSGDLYAAGSYQTSTTWGNKTVSGGSTAPFLGRINSNTGAPVWVVGVEQTGGGARDPGTITVDASEVVHFGFSLNTGGAASFAGVSLPLGGGARIFELSGASGAALRHDSLIPSGAGIFLRDMAMLPSGQGVLIGYINGNTTLDGINLTTAGAVDGWLGRLAN